MCACICVMREDLYVLWYFWFSSSYKTLNSDLFHLFIFHHSISKGLIFVSFFHFFKFPRIQVFWRLSLQAICIFKPLSYKLLDCVLIYQSTFKKCLIFLHWGWTLAFLWCFYVNTIPMTSSPGLPSHRLSWPCLWSGEWRWEITCWVFGAFTK